MNTSLNIRPSDLDWKKHTILIVEDVVTNLMFFKAAIERTGVKILWAQDGLEAIEKVQNDKTIDVKKLLLIR